MQRFVTTRSGIRLWTETFGDSGAPPVLLIMGGMAQAIMWPDAFCRDLAHAGHLVVRYDHRDTGRSSSLDAELQPYDLDHLAEDAAEVIRQVIGGPAHVVGQSAGGMMAQLLALDTPELVRSLVLLSSSPDASGALRRPAASEPLDAEPVVIEYSGPLECQPPRAPQTAIEAQVAGWRNLVGTHAPFDEPYWRALIERAARRTQPPDTAGNHAGALSRSRPRTHRLGDIGVPTLVIHGRRDPLLPIEHGRALAAGIPGATMVEIDDLGHVFPPQWLPRLRDLILGHLAPLESPVGGTDPSARSGLSVGGGICETTHNGLTSIRQGPT
ncbi:MAG: alpha/beta hydrolase fold [Dactylosporangium sp.]|jgi:pimeloyl-ACP methyl ester carboxylesterase|nr:alpha/beta hydrolase fold [Dactylosporangium sp.]